LRVVGQSDNLPTVYMFVWFINLFNVNNKENTKNS
jgi:hypothetical protein